MKKKVILLRGNGKTYTEIQKIIGTHIPKSTLSCWCGQVELNDKQRKRISDLKLNNLKIARAKALITNKQNRVDYLRSIELRITHLGKFLRDKNIKKILLAMLYLGEGAKWKSHRGLQLGNSNPDIMKLYIKLLKDCFGVSPKQLTAIVYYRADQNFSQLVEFWSGITKIPKGSFYKSKPDKRTKNKKTWDGYYGVCAVMGPGTDIQLELEAIAKMFFRL